MPSIQLTRLSPLYPVLGEAVLPITTAQPDALGNYHLNVLETALVDLTFILAGLSVDGWTRERVAELMFTEPGLPIHVSECHLLPEITP